MPITYTIDHAQKMVFVHGSGTLDIDTCVDHLRALSGDPEFDSTYHRLADYLQADSHVWSAGDVKRFVNETEVLAEKLGRSKYAIVVSRKVHFGMARMFQLMKDDESVGVFYGEKEARAWLGLD